MESNSKKTYKEVLNIVKKLEKIENLKELFYFSGEVVPFLILSEESGNSYTNLNFICENENMNKIRDILKNNKLYESSFDSKVIFDIDDDYGFSFEIDNFLINVCPFQSSLDGIVQRTYNCVTGECRVMNFPKLKKSDYVSIYKDSNNKKILSLSIETVIMMKCLEQKNTNFVEYEKCKKIGINKEKLIRVNESFCKLQEKTIIPQKRVKKVKVSVNKKKPKTVVVRHKKNGFVNITTISSVFMFVLAVIFLIIYVGKN